MKYAHIERERRFLLKQLPAGLVMSQFTLIEDVYVNNTRLRLRKMTLPDGEIMALKFGQKFADPGLAATQTIMTNFYLNEVEFELLSSLPGKQLVKKRFTYDWHGRRFSIDLFQNQLNGLILAEIEAFTDEELLTLSIPDFAVLDVTNVRFYTGGHLISVSARQLQERLLNDFVE